MTKFKFLDITPEIYEPRYDQLKEWAKEKSCELEWDTKTPGFDEIEVFLQQDFSAYKSLRICHSYCDHLKQIYNHAPIDIKNFRSFEAIDFKVHNKANELWPKSYMPEVIFQQIVKTAKSVDLSGHALLVGSGALMRSALSVLVRLGVQKIHVTSELSQQEVQQDLDRLKQFFLGIQVDVIPKEQLTLLPGQSSILINCISARQDEDIVADLTYLNFLKKSGVVIDLDYRTQTNSLIDEARQIGVHVIDGPTVMSHIDRMWLSERIKNSSLV